MKFKKGDLVICTQEALNEFTSGNYYVVSKVDLGGPHVRLNIVEDDSGRHNGWLAEYFILAVGTSSESWAKVLGFTKEYKGLYYE